MYNNRHTYACNLSGHIQNLLRFKNRKSMGLKCSSDLINVLYITKFLKSNSQMLNGLVGCHHTLKLSLRTHTHTHTPVFMVLTCSQKIMYDCEVVRHILPATLFHCFLVSWVCS